jgi:hypothetical protein
VRDTSDFDKFIADMTALGRAGMPDDIRPLIANLLSEDNRWVSAQRIEVSSGQGIWTLFEFFDARGRAGGEFHRVRQEICRHSVGASLPRAGRNHPIRRQDEAIAQLHPPKGKGAE